MTEDSPGVFGQRISDIKESISRLKRNITRAVIYTTEERKLHGEVYNHGDTMQSICITVLNTVQGTLTLANVFMEDALRRPKRKTKR